VPAACPPAATAAPGARRPLLHGDGAGERPRRWAQAAGGGAGGPGSRCAQQSLPVSNGPFDTPMRAGGVAAAPTRCRPLCRPTSQRSSVGWPARASRVRQRVEQWCGREIIRPGGLQTVPNHRSPCCDPGRSSQPANALTSQGSVVLQRGADEECLKILHLIKAASPAAAAVALAAAPASAAPAAAAPAAAAPGCG
jgi:hypothetical protein